MDSNIPYFQGNSQQQTPVQGKQLNPGLDSVQKTLSEISSGLRILEDRYYNLRKKTQLTDQTLLDAQKSFSKERRLLYDQIMETKMKLQNVLENIELMKQELKDAVKQNDLKVIEKYLDMWDPMQFVTREEVERLLDSEEQK